MAKNKLYLSSRRKSKKLLMKNLNLRRWKKILDPETVAVDTNKPENLCSKASNSDIDGIQHKTSSCEIMVSSDTDLDSDHNIEWAYGSDDSDHDVATDDDGEISDYEIEYETCKLKSESNKISGRRIINVSYFLDKLKSLSHKGFECSFWNMSLVSEKIRGLESIFTFKCDVCGKRETVGSDYVRKEDANGTNLSAVLGSVAAGIGYSQLSELLAAMDIPNMSNKTYSNCQSIISAAIDIESEAEMKKAGEEERRMAIDVGDINKDGIPTISVIVDGAWSKRSYRTNYNALSGVACIIGAKSKKILYMAVKNKYCFVCARAELAEPPEHVCFKNWSSSSTGMEAAIITQGFCKSIETHGLIYAKVIGDGDSSVYRKLTETSPYGPTFVIEKVECRNHLLRNYINKLSELSKDSSFPIILRKKVTSRDTLGRFRYAVTRAVSFRKEEDTSFDTKQVLLKKDIINGPKHIFGEHSQSERYFCTKEGANEESLVPDLQCSGLYDSIMNVNKRLAQNVSSLLHDVDTNAAETFNSVVAKYVGGKRINFALRGGYEIRCKAAAISYNSKGDFLWQLQKALFGGSYQPQHLQRFRQRKFKAAQITSKRQVPKRKLPATTDEHYGPEAACNNIPDMDLDEYSKKVEELLNELANVDRESICLDTMLQSNSEQWKVERRKRITASIFGKICNMRKSTSTAKTVEGLLYSNFRGTRSTAYGLLSETTATSLFQQQYQKVVKKSGLIIDQEFPFLACSPDGLVDDNAILEIKSSDKSGDLPPIEAFEEGRIDFCTKKEGKLCLKMNHKFYFQVQGLLRITNREIAYFVIYTRGGIHVEEIKRDIRFGKQKWLNDYRSSFLIHYCPN